ncbi:hypothetical protein D3C73_870200 [compost metagenome]
MGQWKNALTAQHCLRLPADPQSGTIQKLPIQRFVLGELKYIIAEASVLIQRAVEGRVCAELKEDVLSIDVLHPVFQLKGAFIQRVCNIQVELKRIAGQGMLAAGKPEDRAGFVRFNDCKFAASGEAVIGKLIRLSLHPDLSVTDSADDWEQHRRTACPIGGIPAPDIFSAGIVFGEADKLCSKAADLSLG